MRSPNALCSTPATLAPTSMPTSSSSASGPDREAEALHRPVHVLDRGALLDQPRRLAHVRRQRARGVEPRPVAHDDDVFAEPAAEGHRGRGRPGVGLGGDDRPPAAASSPPARRSACPGSAAGPPRARGRGRAMGIDDVLLATTQSSPAASSTSASTRRFSVEVLEHRLDDEVGAAEPGRVDGGREQVHPPLELQPGEAAPAAPLLELLAGVAQPARQRLERGVLQPHRSPPPRRPRWRSPRPSAPRPPPRACATSRGCVPSRIARRPS